MATLNCPSCGHPLDVPEPAGKRTGLWWGIGCLIAAVGGLVVIPVIAILAAIAIPSFVKSRDMAHQNVCVNNMRLIDVAKQEFSREKGLTASDPVSPVDLSALLDGGLGSCACPKGGSYTIGALGQDPECSVHGTLSSPHTGAGRTIPVSGP